MAKAKTRLTKILTQAVGLVSNPANERTFLVLKNMPDVTKDGAGGETPGAPADPAQPDAGAPADAAPKPVSMPAQVKEALSAGLASALDLLSKIAEAVTGAQADDAAEVPVDLLTQLDACAGQLDELADTFIMDEPGSMGEATMSADGAPTTKAKKAPPVETPRRQQRLIAKKRLGALKDIHKAMTEGHGSVGQSVKALDAMCKELAGDAGAPPAKDPKEEPAKKSMGEEVSAILAPFLSEFREAVTAAKANTQALADRLSTVEKAAPRPNGAIVEETTHAGPQREPSFKQKLKDALANKTT